MIHIWVSKMKFLGNQSLFFGEMLAGESGISKIIAIF
jgi:hypothetical protein